MHLTCIDHHAIASCSESTLVLLTHLSQGQNHFFRPMAVNRRSSNKRFFLAQGHAGGISNCRLSNSLVFSPHVTARKAHAILGYYIEYNLRPV